MIKISIIVPVYNVELYLHECINSIMNQTYNNIEIILVNDGSTDNSSKICDDYEKKDNRIKVIHKNNGGPMEAIIYGISVATGDFIGFVDSDDYIESNMYQTMIEAAISTNSDIVQCDIIHEGESYSRKVLNNAKNILLNKDEIMQELLPQIVNFWKYSPLLMSPSRCNKIFRRELLIDNIKYYDARINYGEDLSMIFSILFDCERVLLLKDCLYHYRVNLNSITTTYKREFSTNNQRLVQCIQKICEQKDNEGYFMSYCNNYYNYLLLQEVINECNSRHNILEKWLNVRKKCKKDFSDASFEQLALEIPSNHTRIVIFLLRKKLYFILVLIYWFYFKIKTINTNDLR